MQAFSKKMIEKKIIISPLFYFPPIEFYFHFINSEKTIFEKHEHFVKQSYRNRCIILGANGKLDLSIPIIHESNEHIKMSEVKICHNQKWQKLHWKSIESAYRSSPYFEFYEDEIRPLFEIKEEKLIDFNFCCFQILLKITGLENQIAFSESFIKSYDHTFVDLRSTLHPKKKSELVFSEYHQVFTHKFGFTNNLSVLDLLFNKGPETQDYLLSIET